MNSRIPLGHMCRIGAVLLALSFIPEARAQYNIGGDSVRVVPGAAYAAGGVHRFFFGDHWRDLWTSEISVPVLDMEGYAGGLEAIRRGGGFQTQSLRLLGADGIQYKFRSLNKDPGKVLPPELQQTVVADIIQDQISTAHPLAAIIVAPIANSIGILQAEPTLVVLPDSPRLGEFRAEFAGLLGTLEVHPDEGEEDGAGFAGADKVAGTAKLFEKLEDDNDEMVGGAEFLKARLTDIFLGDWDRHTDQWRWARYDRADGRQVWHPIARDRDQAFARYDGLFPWIAARAVRQLEGFSESYPAMEYLTWSGRHLDRRYLGMLSRRTWDSVTTLVHSRLGDEVIEQAVRRMPKEWFALEGARLIADLKARRDKLPDVSEEYYYQMKEVVDVWLSNKREYISIQRASDSTLVVSIFKRDKENGGPQGDTLHHFILSTRETDELRLYLMDGDDYVELSGTVDCSIDVLIIGGEGGDEIVDKSHVCGNVPFIPTAATKTWVYDSGKKTQIEYGSGTCYISREEPEPQTWAERYEPQSRDRGYDWRFGPLLGYTTDNGPELGGGPILYKYGFRNDPYVYRQELLLGYAPFVERGVIDYTLEAWHLLRSMRLKLNLRAGQLDHLNYFGPGNGAELFRSELEEADFYRVNQTALSAGLMVDFPIGKSMRIGLHTAAQNTRHRAVDEADSTLLLNGFRDAAGALLRAPRPYGTDDISMLKLGLHLSFDTRDNSVAATEGIYLRISADYTPEVFNTQHSFASLAGEIRAYFSADILTDVTLALRAGGESLLADYAEVPFFAAPTLGGVHSLRGYHKERFVGESAVYAAAELRMYLLPVRIVLPGRMGIMASVDAGRVFLEGDPADEPDVWHTAPGGGIWLSFVENTFTLSAGAHHSEELLGLYVAGGFSF